MMILVQIISKINLHEKHFMVGQIDYILNCVMIIVDHVLNLEELYINKNV